MAQNTSVSLGDHFAKFVDDQVSSGRYNSASEVVRDGLRLLENEDQKLAWLREQIAHAEAQVRNGEVYEDSDSFWEDLNREVDERLRRSERPNPQVCP